MTSQISARVRRVSVGFSNGKGMVFVLALCYINVLREVGNCHYWDWHELFVQFHEILFM